MASNLIATGSGAENSDDFTLASGETASLVIRDPAGEISTLFIDQKDEVGNYHEVGRWSRGSVVVMGPGTFRVRRDAGGKSCGVFRG